MNMLKTIILINICRYTLKIDCQQTLRPDVYTKYNDKQEKCFNKSHAISIIFTSYNQF